MMDAQTIRSLHSQIQSHPPTPSPGTQAHATLQRSPSAGDSLELKLYIPISATTSSESEPMPIIIAYPVPGPQSQLGAVPMEVRDSAITLESVPPPMDVCQEKNANLLGENAQDSDPDEGFDVVDVNELDGWQENKHRILRALNLPINLNKLRLMRASGTVPPPLTFFGFPKNKIPRKSSGPAMNTHTSNTAVETIPNTKAENEHENEMMETEHRETWYLPSARRSRRRQAESERQQRLDLAAQQEHERNMAMVEEWTQTANSAYPYYGYIQNHRPVYYPSTPYFIPGQTGAMSFHTSPPPSHALQTGIPLLYTPAAAPAYPDFVHSPGTVPLAAPQPIQLAPIASLQIPPTASPVIPVEPSPPSSHPPSPRGHVPSPTPSKRPLGYMYAPATPSTKSHLATPAPTPGSLHSVTPNSIRTSPVQKVISAHGSPQPQFSEGMPVLPYKTAYSYAYDLLTPPPSVLDHSPIAPVHSANF